MLRSVCSGLERVIAGDIVVVIILRLGYLVASSSAGDGTVAYGLGQYDVVSEIVRVRIVKVAVLGAPKQRPRSARSPVELAHFGDVATRGRSAIGEQQACIGVPRTARSRIGLVTQRPSIVESVVVKFLFAYKVVIQSCFNNAGQHQGTLGGIRVRKSDVGEVVLVQRSTYCRTIVNLGRRDISV